MSHGFHNHQRHSRPDEKMGRQRIRRWIYSPGDRPRVRSYPSSVQRQVEQAMSNRKRRQRDRTEGDR